MLFKYREYRETHLHQTWWTWERIFGFAVLALLAIALLASLF